MYFALRTYTLLNNLRTYIIVTYPISTFIENYVSCSYFTYIHFYVPYIHVPIMYVNPYVPM